MGVLGLYLRGGLGFAVASALGSAAGAVAGCFLSGTNCDARVFYGFLCVLSGGLDGFFFGGSDGGVFGTAAGWAVCLGVERDGEGARIGGLVGAAAVGAAVVAVFEWACAFAGFGLAGLCSFVSGGLGAFLGFVAGRACGWRGLAVGLLAGFVGFAIVGAWLGSAGFAFLYSAGMFAVYVFARWTRLARV